MKFFLKKSIFLMILKAKTSLHVRKKSLVERKCFKKVKKNRFLWRAWLKKALRREAPLLEKIGLIFRYFQNFELADPALVFRIFYL